jgi:glycosyltransferase involved in cell wall biosynthesis
MEEKNCLPLISIIIPAYKAENDIARAIDSVLTQEGIEVEVIVVEDGRFDNTHNIVEKYDHRVKLITLKKNRGACFARNKGLAEATGKYVMFLDADDYLEGPLLRGLVQSIEANNSSVAFAPCKKVGPAKHLKSVFYPPVAEDPVAVVTRWLSRNSGPGTCSVLWTKSEVDRIGGWNEEFTLNQDGEIIMRAMFNQCTVSSSCDGFGVYRQHESERISRNYNSQAFVSLEKLERYVREQIELKPEFSDSVGRALNYFLSDIAAKAFNAGQNDIYLKWAKKWNRTTPNLRDRSFLRPEVFVVNLLYWLLGIRRGERVSKVLKKARNRVFFKS